MHSRRSVLKMATSSGVLAAVPAPILARLELGSANLQTVSDGNLVLPGSFIFDGMPEGELQTVLEAFELSSDRITPPCNLTLLQDGPRNILFDVGSGPDFMPTAGNVVASLEAIGLAPEDITHVVFTHAHPDHIWGLLDDFDEPVFYEATYMMGKAEWEYWWNPATVDTIGDARAAFAVGAKRRMEAVEDKIILFGDGDEVLPGIAALATPGHTPGHMAFEVRQGSTGALVVGDAIGNHHVAFRRPSWVSGSDQDGEMAAASRTMLFDRLTNEDLTVVGFHLPAGGIGHAEMHDDGFLFVPEGV
ncbi:MAG: MBL fold metallo-hydrolase [Marinovum sp.]|nr:MBL fold metallo-hydrolase [Marinovum sp.]